MAGTTNLFADKASCIIRVLLVNYPKTWNLRELAKEAGVTLSWTSEVSNALIRGRYAIRESKRGELKMMDPMGLLRRWAAYNNYSGRHKFVHYYSYEQEIEKFVGQLKSKKGPQYALTTLVGALQVAPYVRPTNVHIYVKSEDDAKRWAKLLDLKPTEEGGNIIFAIPDDSGVFYGVQNVNGINVVSNIQLYVDLLNYPARGEEAAGELIKKIEREWVKKG